MPATDHAVALTRTAARAAAEKKAGDIVAIDVSERLVLTDVFLILSGDNDAHRLHRCHHSRATGRGS